jgi:hypothetical protein
MNIIALKERELYNRLYEIRNCKRFIKQTSNYVWGKDVIRMIDLGNGEYKKDRHELENWYISLPCTEKTNIDTLIDCFKSLVEDKETINGKTLEELQEYTVHQLCDWVWLTDDSGKIIRTMCQV